VSDLNSLTVLEFAVRVLEVRHIIVVGHYDCGAVKSAVKHQDHGLIECWLRNIRDVYRLHRHQVIISC
jgi:carbonic anhydrase